MHLPPSPIPPTGYHPFHELHLTQLEVAPLLVSISSIHFVMKPLLPVGQGKTLQFSSLGDWKLQV